VLLFGDRFNEFVIGCIERLILERIVDTMRPCCMDSWGVLAMSKQSDRQLRKTVQEGGMFAADHASDVEQTARELDYAYCVAECSKARNRSALFRAVVKAVDYPQFFGGNFEGLYDCLSETVADQKTGLVLFFQDLHSADPGLEADMQQLQETLDDVVNYARDQGKVFLFSIEHGGKHPEDEPGVVHNWSED
jgi:RNAse (barnase) inhibitor barstar